MELWSPIDLCLSKYGVFVEDLSNLAILGKMNQWLLCVSISMSNIGSAFGPMWFTISCLCRGSLEVRGTVSHDPGELAIRWRWLLLSDNYISLTPSCVMTWTIDDQFQCFRDSQNNILNSGKWFFFILLRSKYRFGTSTSERPVDEAGFESVYGPLEGEPKSLIFHASSNKPLCLNGNVFTAVHKVLCREQEEGRSALLVVVRND